MRFIKFNVCFFLAFVFFANVANAQELSVRANKYDVSVGEPFSIFIEYKGSSDAAPDLSVLDGGFEVLGQSTSTQMNIINGSVSSKKVWNVRLTAKEKGVATIPSFEIESAKSEPIKINVAEEGSTVVAGKTKDVFMTSSVSKNTSFVQEEVIYTVKLFDGVGVSGEDPVLEKNSDFIVQKLGKYTVSQEVIDGRPYRIFQFKYALYPQRAGKLTTPKVVFNGQIEEVSGFGRNNLFDFGFSNGSVFKIPDMRALKKTVRAAAKQEVIKVKDIPAQAKGKWWLPAVNVEIADVYKPDVDELKVGDTITRRIALNAQGVSSKQLPDVFLPEVEGFKQYPNSPETSDTKSKNTITGFKQKSVVYIASKVGEFTLKPVEVYWWDVNENKLKVAKTQPKTIRVVAGESQQISDEEQKNTDLEENFDGDEQDENLVAAEAQNISEVAKKSFAYFEFVLGLVLGAFISFIFFVCFEKKQAKSFSNPEVENYKEQASLSDVKRAIGSKDVKKVRDELLKWARKMWKQNPPITTLAIAKRLENEALEKHILQLEKNLYASGDEKINFSDLEKTLLSAIEEYEKNKAKSYKAVPDLYPN
jgi:hypothetical protein